MERRILGRDLEVSAIGLGCMSMTGDYSDRPDRAEMLDLVRTAVDLGITFFDTAEIYGPYANEELLGEALAPFKDQVVIATKFGWDIDPVERKPRGAVTSNPAVIRQSSPDFSFGPTADLCSERTTPVLFAPRLRGRAEHYATYG